MSVNTRELCVDILIKVMEDGVHCNTALHECMNKKPALDKEERAFLTKLTVGTVERIIELDYILNLYSNKPVNKMKPYISNILRMSVYQIKYMDSVPDSAVVNEAVKLAASKGYGGLRGFVNGILRNIARNIDSIGYPDKDSDTVRYLSVKYSIPEWLAEHFLKEMSVEEVIATMEYYYDCNDTVIRFTGDEEKLLNIYEGLDIECERGHIFDYAYRLTNPGRIDRLPGYDNGEFVVADESSMIPGHIAINWIRNKYAGRESRVEVLDMCAAPGGKSLHIASELRDNVHIDACDISDYKVSKIADNRTRLKLNNISESISDALVYDESKSGKYDVVIADLPCSGMGVLAGKPDIKYNVKQSSLKELADIQKKMLDNAARYTAPGGLLIYSTCTIDRLENEENAYYFLEKNKDYEICDLNDVLNNNYPKKLKESIDRNGYIRIIPGNVESAGFFIAAFCRKDVSDSINDNTDYSDIRSFALPELTEIIEGMGHKKFRAAQIYEWLHKKLVKDWDDMTNIPKNLRKELSEKYEIYPLRILEKVVSGKDGTVKYLMSSSDGGVIESVAMNYNYGMSVCISSQIGCRMGCSFCASTLAGLERGLKASEMLSQVYLIQKDMGRRVDNIVVMGIGEPFDNYEQLIKFIRMVSDESGLNISQRSITVSTCGLVDKIYDFADEHMGVTLAVSLHAPNDNIRKSIMPVARRYSIDEIMKACRYFTDKTGRRVTFEYSMINEVNDTKECAEELAGLLKGLLCHVNLIPLNDVTERIHRRSSDEGISVFQNILIKHRINVTIRKGMGSDIDAACGQLRKKYIDKKVME